MPLNYNFAFKNSNLKKWERPKVKNILAIKRTNKEKIIFLYQTIKRNPEIFYPPSVIIIISFAIQLISIYPQTIINRLESKNKEFEILSRKLSNSQSQIKSMRKFSLSVNDYYSKPLPSYLFTFYLQNSVPKGVQLTKYSISENGFDIEASAYDIESLNEMVTLLINSPIINSNSLAINKILQENSLEQSLFNIEIQGKLLKLNDKQRELLYSESSANGLLDKFERFKYFSNLIR